MGECSGINPPPLRTNRTRRVLHPVLIGHAASRTLSSSFRSITSGVIDTYGGDLKSPPTKGRTWSGSAPWNARSLRKRSPIARDTCAPRAAQRRRGGGGARRTRVLADEAERRVASPPPPSRTNWTRLVPPSVLTGHVSERFRSGRRGGGRRARAADLERAFDVPRPRGLDKLHRVVLRCAAPRAPQSLLVRGEGRGVSD